ncbi:hypothetical protein ACF08W_28810 [Streptomyces sp. NPDC015144]|uniref:hypothetical protein n=1 Tax=Streptomyces sp. NPDC015144 TaxID=3364944 RepID=UPI0036FB7206
MPNWLGKFKLAAYALGLLAVAHPAIVPPTVATLGVLAGVVFAVVGWFLAHLALTLTLAAGVLLAQAFPGRLGNAARWFGRAWDTSIDAILPVKA